MLKYRFLDGLFVCLIKPFYIPIVHSRVDDTLDYYTTLEVDEKAMISN